MNPQCQRCKYEPTKAQLATGLCPRCEGIRRVLGNIIHSPRVPPSQWPAADLDAVSWLIGFARSHNGGTPIVGDGDCGVFEQWRKARELEDAEGSR